jgi:hypothetical protein
VKVGFALAAAALVASATAFAAGGSPYPLLVERGSVRIHAPAPGQRWGLCPREALALAPRQLAVARRAVLLGVPSLYRRLYRGTPRIDTRGARARAGLARGGWPRHRDALQSCGRRVWRRTAVVDVVFPRVTFSASLSQASFYVSRVRGGWVIWHQVH